MNVCRVDDRNVGEIAPNSISGGQNMMSSNGGSGNIVMGSNMGSGLGSNMSIHGSNESEKMEYELPDQKIITLDKLRT